MVRYGIVAIALLSSSAYAEPIAIKRVGEWVLKCDTSTPKKPLVGDCWIEQGVELEGQPEIWASVDFRYTGAEEPRITFSIPEEPVNNEFLGIRVDKQPYIRFRVGDCENNICPTDIAVPPDTLTMLLATKQITVNYKIGDEKRVLFPLDLSEFPTALRELRSLMGLKN